MMMYKKTLLVLLFLTAVAFAGAGYGYWDSAQTNVLDTAETEPAEQAQIFVYVSGAVQHPGVVQIAETARAADAVNACGGVLPSADLNAINMAKKLQDGMQLLVPEQGATGPAEEVSAKQKNKEGKVNINTADEKALDQLPGIGPSLAKRIVEYRKKEGNFLVLEDLKKVQGIGAAKFERLREKICI